MLMTVSSSLDPWTMLGHVKSYMLGHHVYYKNSFCAWQISGHDIVRMSCAIYIYKVQSCQDVVSHGPIRIPLMRFTLLAN